MNISLSTHRTLHAMLEEARDPGDGVSLCIGRKGMSEVHVHCQSGLWEIFDRWQGQRLTWGESQTATEAQGSHVLPDPPSVALKLVSPVGEAVVLSGERI